MKVLVACEMSGVVRDAFRSRGHNASSCDIIPSLDNSEFHIQDDVFNIIRNGWDMMIAFPPCTHLAVSGARWFKDKKVEQEEAIRFFIALTAAPIEKIAIENPIGIMSRLYRKPDQIIQPWQFGHPETKATCLWLKGLPKLRPTDVVGGRTPRVHYESPGIKNGLTRAQRRAITYTGIATAMSEQWSESPKENHER